MQIKEEQFFFGPNLYSKAPVIVYSLNVSEFEIAAAEKACVQIVEAFPQCFTSTIVNESTPNNYIGMVLSQLSKYFLNTNNASIQYAGVTVNSESVLIWLEFHHLRISLLAMKTVWGVFQALMTEKDLNSNDVQAPINFFRKFCANKQPRRSPFFELSRVDNIPMTPCLSVFNAWQFGWGKNSRVFSDSAPMEDSYQGVKVSLNKVLSLKMLKDIGLPIAKSIVISKEQEFSKAEELIGYPCVVKPIKGTHGAGITINIKNRKELQIAYDFAKRSAFGQNPILIESFVEGEDHRIHIYNGKFLGAIQRRASHVVGDGRLTLKDLIFKLNTERLETSLLKTIQLDDALRLHINKLGASLTDIIEKNKIITLSSVANYSAGGVVEDVTDLVHPHNIQMAELIAQASGIVNLGVDYMTTDIGLPYHQAGGAVIEFNHHADLKLFNFLPKPKRMLRQVLNIGSGRVPVVVVILSELELASAQKYYNENIEEASVGWASADTAYIGALPLKIQENSGWESVKILFRNKSVAKALIVCSDNQIMEKGLPVDKADCICMHEVNLSPAWHEVVKSATAKVKTFNDSKGLLDFTLREMATYT